MRYFYKKISAKTMTGKRDNLSKNFRHTFNSILRVMCAVTSRRDIIERYGKCCIPPKYNFKDSWKSAKPLCDRLK